MSAVALTPVANADCLCDFMPCSHRALAASLATSLVLLACGGEIPAPAIPPGAGGEDLPAGDANAPIPALAHADPSAAGARVFIDPNVNVKLAAYAKTGVPGWPTELRTQVERRLQEAGFVAVFDAAQPHDVSVKLSGEVYGQFVYFFSAASLRLERGQTLIEDIRFTWGRGDSRAIAPDRVAVQLVNAMGTTPRIVAALAQRSTSATATAATQGAPATEPVHASPEPSVEVRTDFVSGTPQRSAYAVVVGIDVYRDAPAAKGAERDAETMGALLRQTLGVPEDHVVVATGARATRMDIEKHLEWLKTSVPAGGRTYFYFSGHGAPDAKDGTPYIVPYDGDPRRLDKTAIPLASVLRTLSETKAPEVIAFVDSCFSGAGGRSILPPGARPLVRVKETPVSARVALFSASAGNEISGPAPGENQGLFTKYLAEGLGAGRADGDGDGQITLQELSDWVRPRVVREAKKDHREQTPTTTVSGGAAAASKLAIGWGLPSR